MATTPTRKPRMTAEAARLEEAREMSVPWRQWGPYLSERQWGTVRECFALALWNGKDPPLKERVYHALRVLEVMRWPSS